LENLEEMDKFLDTYDQQKEDINHVNRSITSDEIEAAIVSKKEKSRT
jgi:type I restriction-modification system DNA methylase subunit